MHRLEPEVRADLPRYDWPGNVRELENLIERICMIEDGDCMRLEHLPLRIHAKVVPARHVVVMRNCLCPAPCRYSFLASRQDRLPVGHAAVPA
jgi:transcriptional regulator with PAS, ATPase and Fis domain